MHSSYIHLLAFSFILKPPSPQKNPRLKHRALFKNLFVYFRLLLRRKNAGRRQRPLLGRRFICHCLTITLALGLLYCIWHLECSLPAAFPCVSPKRKIVFRGRLITLFTPSSPILNTVEEDGSLAAQAGKMERKAPFSGFYL